MGLLAGNLLLALEGLVFSLWFAPSKPPLLARGVPVECEYVNLEIKILFPMAKILERFHTYQRENPAIDEPDALLAFGFDPCTRLSF